MTMIWIAGFGVVGVLARYGLDRIIQAQLTFEFPLATFLINILGSLLAGVVYVLASERMVLSDPLKTALLVGFCGGFTTFSAYTLQSFLLIESKQVTWSLLYLFVSPIAGLASVYLGVALTRVLIHN